MWVGWGIVKRKSGIDYTTNANSVKHIPKLLSFQCLTLNKIFLLCKNLPPLRPYALLNSDQQKKKKKRCKFVGIDVNILSIHKKPVLPSSCRSGREKSAPFQRKLAPFFFLTKLSKPFFSGDGWVVGVGVVP